MSAHCRLQVCGTRYASNRFGWYRHDSASWLPQSALEIQPHCQLDLPGWCDLVRCSEGRICGTTNSVFKLLRNGSREGGGPVDRVNAIDVGAIEQVEDFSAGLGLYPFAQVKHPLQ